MTKALMDALIERLDRQVHSQLEKSLLVEDLPRQVFVGGIRPLVKSDVNTKKGIITAYLTAYNNPDGTPYIDAYHDIIAPGAFTNTITELEKERRLNNSPWLCPDLFQHDRNQVIGGIKGLTQDSKGVIYEAYLAMGVPKAREVMELAERKMLGSSYGYDAKKFEYLPGDIRRLTEIGLKEVSQVTFPANPRADILDVKHSTASYPGEPTRAAPFDRLLSLLENEMKEAKREATLQKFNQSLARLQWEYGVSDEDKAWYEKRMRERRR